MSKDSFDPNGVGIANGNFFGFPYTLNEAAMVFIPVPWDVTTSYGAGTSNGPQAILDASPQLDFYDFDVPDAWKYTHSTLPISDEIANRSRQYRAIAEKVINALEQEHPSNPEALDSWLEEVNEGCEWLRKELKSICSQYLDQGKLIGLVGGDHSTPLGFLDALSEHHESFGILQIDAHADLREAYEGFTYSHASIMYNVLKIPQVSKLVQVGIRDICPEEIALTKADNRIQQFNDFGLKQNAFHGMLWKEQCEIIVDALPQLVYISFDIDGLSPDLCPNTGTPVPGGLSFQEASFLIKSVVDSGRKIIGFDLNEVSPGEDEWDANVGARMLYKLRNFMALSSMIKK